MNMIEDQGIPMVGVTEYAEELQVRLVRTTGKYSHSGQPYHGAGRLAIRSFNEAGHSCTEVDLEQIIAWVRDNMPELLEKK